MNIKECILDNIKCNSIIIKKKGKEDLYYFKKEGEQLINLEEIVNKRVLTSTRVGNDKIIIIYR